MMIIIILCQIHYMGIHTVCTYACILGSVNAHKVTWSERAPIQHSTYFEVENYMNVKCDLISTKHM